VWDFANQKFANLLVKALSQSGLTLGVNRALQIKQRNQNAKVFDDYEVKAA